jgi:hypothetical protein
VLDPITGLPHYGESIPEAFSTALQTGATLVDPGVPTGELMEALKGTQGVVAKEGYNYEGVLADAQGGGTQAFNATVGGIASGFLTAAEDLSYILDIPGHYDFITGADTWERNFVAEWAIKNKEALSRAMPIYRKSRGDVFDWSDFGWYMENMKGAIDSMVGYGVPGWGVSKAVTGAVGAALNAGRKVAMVRALSKSPSAMKYISAGGTGLLTNYAEGKIMGMEIHDRIMKDPEFQHLDLEQRKIEASKAASDFLMKNRIWMFTDAIATIGIHKGAGHTRNVAETLKKEPFLKRITKFNPDNPIGQGAVEYVEEVGQFGLQEDAVYNAKKNLGIDVSQDPDNYVERLAGYVTSEQATLEGLIGFFSAGPQRFLTKKLDQLVYDASRGQLGAQKESREKQLADIEKQTKENTTYVKQFMDRMVAESSLKEEGDINNRGELAKILDKFGMYRVFANNFSKGTTENIEQLLTDIAEGNLSEEEMAQYPPEAQELASELLGELAEMEEQWIKDFTYANKGEIFADRIKKKALEQIQEITEKELEEASAAANKDIANLTKAGKFKDISYDLENIDESNNQENYEEFAGKVKGLESYKEYLKRKEDVDSAIESVNNINESIAHKTTVEGEEDFLKRQREAAEEAARMAREEAESSATDDIVREGDTVQVGDEIGTYVGTTTVDGNLVHQVEINGEQKEFTDDVEIKKRESVQKQEEQKKEQEKKDNNESEATEEDLTAIAQKLVDNAELIGAGTPLENIFSPLEMAVIANNEDKIDPIYTKLLEEQKPEILAEEETEEETPAEITREELEKDLAIEGVVPKFGEHRPNEPYVDENGVTRVKLTALRTRSKLVEIGGKSYRANVELYEDGTAIYTLSEVDKTGLPIASVTPEQYNALLPSAVEEEVSTQEFLPGDRVVHSRLGEGTVSQYTPNSGKYSVRFDNGRLTKAGIPIAQSVNPGDLLLIERAEKEKETEDESVQNDTEEVQEEPKPNITSAADLIAQANLKKAQSSTAPDGPSTPTIDEEEDTIEGDVEASPGSIKVAWKPFSKSAEEQSEVVFLENAQALEELFEDPNVSLKGIDISFSIDPYFIRGNKFEKEANKGQELTGEQAAYLPIRGTFEYQGKELYIWLHNPDYEALSEAQVEQLKSDKLLIYNALRQGREVTTTISNEGYGYVSNYTEVEEDQLPSLHEMLGVDPNDLQIALRAGDGTLIAGKEKVGSTVNQKRLPKSAKLTKDESRPGDTYVLTKGANGKTVPLRTINRKINYEEASLIYDLYHAILSNKVGGWNVQIQNYPSLVERIRESTDPAINGIDNFLTLEGRDGASLQDVIGFLVYQGSATDNLEDRNRRLFISGNQINYGLRFAKLDTQGGRFTDLNDIREDFISHIMEHQRRIIHAFHTNTPGYNEYLSTAGITKGVNIPNDKGRLFRNPVISLDTAYNIEASEETQAENLKEFEENQEKKQDEKPDDSTPSQPRSKNNYWDRVLPKRKAKPKNSAELLQKLSTYLDYKGKTGIKASKVLKGVKENTKDPLLKATIAILEQTDFKAFYNSELGVFVTSEEDFVAIRTRDGITTEKVAKTIPAFYDESNHTIVFNEKFIDYLTVEDINRTLIHELLHPATAIPFGKKQRGEALTEREERFVNEITTIHEMFKDYYDKSLEDTYGFSTAPEFISELMSNYRFREEMHKANRTFYQRIWDAIKRFFGLPVDSDKIIIRAEDLIKGFIEDSKTFTPEEKTSLIKFYDASPREAYENRKLAGFKDNEINEVVDVLTYALVRANKVKDLSDINKITIDNFNTETGEYEGPLTTFLNDMWHDHPDKGSNYKKILELDNFEAIRERVIDNLSIYGIKPKLEQDADDKVDGKLFVSSFETNQKDNASSNIKVLVAFNLAVESIDEVTGDVVYKTGEYLGLPSFNNYTATWNTLQKNLEGIVSTETKADALEKMTVKIEELAQFNPSLTAFSKFLRDEKVPLQKKAQFYNAFALNKIKYSNSYFKKNEDGTVSFRVGKADTMSNEDIIKEQWANDYVERLFTRDKNNNPVFNEKRGKELLAEYREINKRIGEYEELTDSEYKKELTILSSLLKKVGVDMPIEALNYFVVEGIQNENFEDRTDGIMALSNDVISKIFTVSEAKGKLIGYSIENMLRGQEAEVEYGHPVTPIENERRIISLLKFAEFFKETLVDSTTLGAEGNKLWNYSLYDYVSQMMAEMKEDPSRLEQMAKMPYYQNKRLLKWLLKDPRNREAASILQWSTFKEENAGHLGNAYSDMSFNDDIFDRVHRVLDGYFPYPNAADKSRHLNFVGDRELNSSGNSVSIVNGEIQIEVGERAVDELLGHFEDELRSMQAAWDHLFSEDDKLMLPENKHRIFYHYDMKGEGGTKRLKDENGVPVGNAFKSFLFPGLTYGEIAANDIGLYKESEKGKPFTIDSEFRNNPELRAYIKNALKKSFDKEYQKIIDSGVFSEEGDNIDPEKFKLYRDAIIASDSNQTSKMATKLLLAEVSYNSMIQNIELTALFIGDPRFYKSAPDVKKRTPAGIATGQSLFIYEGYVRETYTRAVLEDLLRPSEFFTSGEGFDLIKKSLSLANPNLKGEELEKETQRIINQYAEVNVTDAQGWITIDRAIEIYRGVGKFTEEHEANIDAIKNGTADYRLMKLFFQPIKGVHFELHLDADDKLATPSYSKYSQAVLLPNMVNGTGLANLKQAMENQGIDEAIVLDGVKVGATDVASWFHKPGKTTDKTRSTIKDKIVSTFKEKGKMMTLGNVSIPYTKAELDDINFFIKKENDNLDVAVDNKAKSLFGKMSATMDMKILDDSTLYIPNPNGYLLWDKFLEKSDNLTKEKAKNILDNKANIILGTLEGLKNIGVETIHFPNNTKSSFEKEFTAFLPVDQSSLPWGQDTDRKTITIKTQDLINIVSAGIEPGGENYSIKSADQIKLNPVTLKNRFWRLQQDLPTKGMKPTLVGSQVKKNIRANIDPNAEYNGLKGSDILRELDDIDIALSNEGLAYALKKMGYDPLTRTFSDIGLLYDYLLRESQDQAIDLKEGLRNQDPFDTMPQYVKKIQNKLNSLITKSAVKLKQLGGSYVQLSSAGFESLPEDVKRRIIKLKGVEELQSSRLQKAKETGEVIITGGQVLLPHSMLIELEEMGLDPYSITAEELVEHIDPEVLEAIGYRIPNQGNSSNDALDIVGFLPPETGDTIVVYKEITKKTGSDFDIDKMYVIAPNYKTDSQSKSIKYIPFLDENNSTLEERAKVYAQNSKEAKDLYREYREKIKALRDRKKRSISAYKGLKTKAEKATVEELSTIIEDLKLERKSLDRLKKSLKKEIKIAENNGDEDTIELKKELEETINRIKEIQPEIQELANKIPEEVREARAELNKKKDSRIEQFNEEMKALEEERDEKIDALVDLEEFAERPMVLQNQVAAIQNRRIELYRKVLLSPSKFAEVMMPLDYDELRENIVALNGESTADDLEFFTLMSNIQDKHDFNGGKFGVGLTANQLVDIALAQAAKIYLNSNIVGDIGNQTADGKIDISGAFDKKNRSISFIISAYLNAYVDIAKDPYITRGNHNILTANVVFTLLRAGVNYEWVNAFISQPIIKEYVELSRALEGRTAEQYSPSATTQIVKNYLGNEATIDDLRLYETKDLSEFSEEDLSYTAAVMNGGAVENFTDGKAVDQVAVFAMFMKLRDISSKLSDSVTASKADTVGSGRNLMEAYAIANRINKVKADGIVENFDKKFEGTALGAYARNSIQTVLEMFSPLFMTAHPAIMNSVDNISVSLYGTPLINNDLGDIIVDEIYAGLMSQVFNNTIPELSKFLFGKESLAQQLKDIKAHSKYQDNMLIEFLSYRIRRKTPSTIGINNTKELPITNQDKLTRAWEEAYFSQDEMLSNFATDLVYMAYITSGFRTNLRSFSKLIPRRVLQDMNMHTKIKNLNRELHNDPSVLSILMPQIFKHNPTNQDLVRRVRRNDRIPIRGLSTNIDMFALPASNYRYVTSLDENMEPIFRPFLFREHNWTDRNTGESGTVPTLFEYIGNTMIMHSDGQRPPAATKVGIYKRTNILGYHDKGIKVYEYSLERDGSESVIKANNYSPGTDTQRNISTFMERFSPILPGPSTYTAGPDVVSTLFINEDRITNKDVLERMKICKGGGKI